MIVRQATTEDISAVADLLDHEIATNWAHFGYTPTDRDALAADLLKADRYPFFVAESEGFLGFAKCNPWKAREGYTWSAEIGVYIIPEARGTGVGKALYGVAIPACRQAGLRTLLAGIALPNAPSVRLHESFGFKQVGLLPKIGFKFGKWIDVGYWSLRLSEEDPIV